LRNRQQPPGLVPISGVDAKDISDSEVGLRFVDDPDSISGSHITLGDNSKVRTGSQRLREAARELGIVHSNSEPPARDPRLGDLENRASDLPALSDHGIVHIDPFRREVFAELRVRERPADLFLPPPCVFDGVGVDGFVGASVCLAIRLLVSGQIDTSSGDASGDRCLPDRALGGPAAVFELARGADADRENSSCSSRNDSLPSSYLADSNSCAWAAVIGLL